MADKKTVAITITANTRRLKADMRRATQEVRAFERQVGGVANRMKRMRMNFMQSGIFGRGGGAIKTAAGFAGVFGFQQLIMDAKNMDAALTDIAITGNLSAGKLGQLKKQMFEVSSATGKSTTEVLSFVSAMTTATGDTGAAMVALKGIGEVAVATGTDMGALGQVFVKLTTSMKILPREARQAFNILRGQEKMGSVTMAQMASILPDVVGGAGLLGKSATGMKGIAALGGLVQITRRGTGSVDEAKTSSVRFMQKLFANRKNIKKYLGVDVEKALAENDLKGLFGQVGTALTKNGNLGKYGMKLFDIRGLKAATQLRDAASVGLGGKLGTLQSFNAIMGAGATDEIGADAARRRKSAAFQFGKAMNDLKIVMQKHALPVFKQLAGTMKEFGPDIAKTLKWILEHSKGLLKLWLGHKGIAFFRNLMAPIQGGAAGGVASQVAGMAQGIGVPGRLIGGPAGRAGWGDTARFGGGGWARGGGGAFVSAGRSGGSYYSARGGALGGMGGPRVAAGGAWGVRGGMSGQGRFGRAYGRAYGAASNFMGRHGGAIGRGAGTIAGAAGMMGYGPDVGPGWANDAANLGLMSLNPYAMMAAGAYKVGQYGKQYGVTGAIHSESSSAGGMAKRIGLGVATLGGTELYRGVRGKFWSRKGTDEKLGLSVDNVTRDLLKLSRVFESASLEIKAKVGRWRNETIEGRQHTERRDILMSELGMGGAGGGFIMNTGALHHQGNKSLKVLRARLQASNAVERRIAMQSLKPGQEATEENLKAANPQYALTATALQELNRTMVEVRDGVNKKTNLNVVIDATGVARRLDMVTQWGPQNDGHPTGRGEGRGQ